jgi:hypothetical protein
MEYHFDFDNGNHYIIVDGKRYKKVKTSWAQGYLSRKLPDRICPYKGKYGIGYTREYQDNRTSRYHIKEYYVEVIE